MLEKMSWSFFEKTGNIEAYIEYISIRSFINSRGGALTDGKSVENKGNNN